MRNLIHGLVLFLFSLTVNAHDEPHEVDAATALQNFADKSRSDRIFNGGVTIVSGAAIAGINLAFDDTAFLDSVVVATVFTGLGLGQILLPTKAEAANERVRLAAESEDVNALAYAEMITLAADAKKRRQIAGFAGLGLGFLFLANQQDNPYAEGNPDLFSGLVFSAGGASALLFKSPAEIALRDFEHASRHSSLIPTMNMAFALNQEHKPTAAVQLAWSF